MPVCVHVHVCKGPGCIVEHPHQLSRGMELGGLRWKWLWMGGEGSG